jgi:formylglycine-generating enzyme required for sulfatase activity
MRKQIKILAVVAALLAGAASARANVVIDTVTVGNPGNGPDVHGAGYGAVGYTYDIGKYEVTAGQYTQFLNAVAASDPYGLYNPDMWSNEYGSKIERTGLSGNYRYSVAPDWADRPVNYVSWGDAARFSNWLHNGQPTGEQGLNTTEAGSYFLNGAMSRDELMAVVRMSDATWVIPNENEWYKAAYHKNNGATGDYWDYPTGHDSDPDNGNPDGDSGNSANFWDGLFAIGGPYFRTEAGHFSMSRSSYGTYDQGGNVWEWNESATDPIRYRGLRGGSFSYEAFGFVGGVENLQAASGHYLPPTRETYIHGFRVGYIPEPSTIALSLVGALAVLACRK